MYVWCALQVEWICVGVCVPIHVCAGQVKWISAVLFVYMYNMFACAEQVKGLSVR